MNTPKRGSLLKKYFKQGWLARRYYNGKCFLQPYSAEDRLYAGEMFYRDFALWRRGTHLTRAYDLIKVDVSKPFGGGVECGAAAERFRRALRLVSKTSLPVVYKIVLEEEEISIDEKMSARERLYFNDEIKGLLCRGLDDLCGFYEQRRR
jgi:hypothetical protein